MGSAAEVEEIGSNVSGGGGGGGDEFYEDIEAPKFVDFTAPDHYNPDDGYWFCSRVGCDRKHEDDVDPDEIYKNFVLRVMAARSPNVRLRKALSRKPTNATKCPLSAPPKPSRPRVPRLAVLSSISKKLMDGKETKPVHPIAATPNPKAKKRAPTSKAMTTLGNKKSVLKPELFCSVRKPKETAVPVQSTKVVAKALVFQSPKKVVRKKTSSELDDSVRKICAGMKKLEITGQRKNILGYENRALHLDASKKRLGVREVKSRVFDSLRSQNHNDKENRPSRCIKKKGMKAELATCVEPARHDASSSDSSDMEVDSHRGSIEESSVAVAAKSDLFEVPVIQAGLDELTKEITLPVEKLVPSLEEKTSQNLLDNEVSENDDSATTHYKEGSHEVSENDDKENFSVINDSRARNEGSENDEKENASTRDDNRSHTEGKILYKQGTNKKIQKATQKDIKGLKEKTADSRSAQGGKYVKPRATNPKPFRLRTDERGVLKETNLEKKLLTPLKETSSTVLGFSDGNLIARKHQKRNGNVSGQCEDESSRQKSEAKIDRMQPDGPRIRSKFSSSSQRAGVQKLPTLTSERRIVSKQQRSTVITLQPKSRESIRRAKLLLLKQQSQRTTSSKKATASTVTHGGRVHGETSSKGMDSKEEPKLNRNAANSASRTVSPGASRSLSRGRNPLTIPKEPNFHTVHVPKSCNQKLA